MITYPNSAPGNREKGSSSPKSRLHIHHFTSTIQCSVAKHLRRCLQEESKKRLLCTVSSSPRGDSSHHQHSRMLEASPKMSYSLVFMQNQWPESHTVCIHVVPENHLAQSRTAVVQHLSGVRQWGWSRVPVMLGFFFLPAGPF